MNLPLSPNDGHAFLLAIGLGAIVGVIFGGWVMATLHKLLMAIVKISLLGAVVVIGMLLWNGYQTSKQNLPLPAASSFQTDGSQADGSQADESKSRSPYPTYHEPMPAPSTERWWE